MLWIEDMRTNKQRLRILLGETARDVGILLLVFGPLDAILQATRHSGLITVTVVTGLGLISVGILVESQE